MRIASLRSHKWSSPLRPRSLALKRSTRSTYVSNLSRGHVTLRPMLQFVLLSVYLILHVVGFGIVGHRLVADIASDLISPHTAHHVHRILNGRPLSSIAGWADSIKHYPRYRFTSELHYINFPEDHPPSSCQFVWEAPGKQEVIAAIHNYTRRLTESELDSWKESESLRFITHFVGDMHQPLHLSGRARGGNDVNVLFDGHHMPLHRVWDSAGLTRRMNEVHATMRFSNHIEQGDRQSPSISFKQYIHGLLTSKYASAKPAWLLCSRNSDVAEYISICPESWAKNLTHFNCEFAWRNVEHGSNLDGDYWQAIQKHLVFEELISMAAVRLATTLDAIFLIDRTMQDPYNDALSAIKHPDL